MKPLENFKARWNRFFFEPIDPRPLGVFRILFGCLLLINAAMIWPDLLVWYGYKGVLSIETAQALAGVPRLNILPLLPHDDAWVIGFFLVHVVAALFLALGLFTRISAIAVFLTVVSFHHRNVFILNSGDTFVRIISFLLIFSQAGAAYSLDRLRKAWSGGIPSVLTPVSPWAQRMIQIQLSMVYFFTVVAKLRGPTWWNGTAVYYASRLEEFQRFPVPWILENLIAIKLLTWGTLAIELAMATLVWIPRLRPKVLLVALALHLSLEYSMNIPLFQWLMISTFVLFIDPKMLRFRVKAPQPVTLPEDDRR